MWNCFPSNFDTLQISFSLLFFLFNFKGYQSNPKREQTDNYETK